MAPHSAIWLWRRSSWRGLCWRRSRALGHSSASVGPVQLVARHRRHPQASHFKLQSTYQLFHGSSCKSVLIDRLQLVLTWCNLGFARSVGFVRPAAKSCMGGCAWNGTNCVLRSPFSRLLFQEKFAGESVDNRSWGVWDYATNMDLGRVRTNAAHDMVRQLHRSLPTAMQVTCGSSPRFCPLSLATLLRPINIITGAGGHIGVCV